MLSASTARSADGPPTARRRHHPAERLGREVCGDDEIPALGGLIGEGVPHPGSGDRVVVPHHRPVVLRELHDRVDGVAEQHRALAAGGHDDHDRAGRVARSPARDDARHDVEVALEQLEPFRDRQEHAADALVRVRAVDEPLPVRPVGPVGRARERSTALHGGPAHVVEMQMGEQHVRHLGGLDAVRPQRLRESATGIAALVERSYSGVHEDQAAAAADQEPADGERPAPVVPELLRVATPRLRVREARDDLRRLLCTAPVRDRLDLEIADVHPTTLPTGKKGRRQAPGRGFAGVGPSLCQTTAWAT
ncbi:hypothetical protein LLS1_10220 [Leifsonia sp. LS1]|nr:hypothetical protein LLS1_10220 [Leifsonia sp. LS1]